MAEIEQTPLPGIGVRYDLTTREGDRLSILTHRSGKRSLLLYDAEDPDRCITTIEMTEDEAGSVADILGATRLVERLARVQLDVEGLAFAWIPIAPDSPGADRTIGDLALRTQTGASAVAVMRGDRGVPVDGPEFRLEPDDTLVVVGPSAGIERAQELLTVP